MVKREFFFDFSLREQTHRVALFTTIRAFYFHEYIFPENVSLVANTDYYLVNVYTVWCFFQRLPQCVIFNACSVAAAMRAARTAEGCLFLEVSFKYVVSGAWISSVLEVPVN